MALKNKSYTLVIKRHEKFKVYIKEYTLLSLLITKTTTHLSWKSLVVNQVLRSAIVFASKMKMELLKSVLVTLQGTATKFSAPL